MNRNRFLRREWMPVLPLIAVFIAVAALYAWATPIFEASDELWHFGMVDYLATNRALPIQDVANPETAYRQEGSQPPLYYILAALLVQGIDRNDFATLSQPNPHALVGIPGAVGNKNIVLHRPLQWPLQGTELAVYSLRVLGIGLGVVTLIGVYGTSLALSGRRFAIFTTGFAVFNPMFLFITASVNNDTLVIALCSLALWQISEMGWWGFRGWRSVLLALIGALAGLSKLSGNIVLPVMLGVGYYLYRRDDARRGFITLTVAVVVAWGAIAGWWYARNWMLYGELFGTHTMAEIAGVRQEPFTALTLLNEAEGFRATYWGVFGGVNVLTWRGFYPIMDAVTLLAVLGLGWALYRIVPDMIYLYRNGARSSDLIDRMHAHWLLGVLIFGGTLFIASLTLLSWTAQTYASQGRLLFPFIAASTPLLTSGLLYIVPSRFKNYAVIAALAVWGIVALLIPIFSIRTAYTPPRPIQALPADARPAYARFGDVELLGYRAVDRRYQPGESVPITLYWRVAEPSSSDLSMFVTALENEGRAIGAVNSYPGGGTLQTSTWQEGAIYPDTYAIPLPPRYAGQFNLRAQVGWWDYPSRTYMNPTDAAGDPLQSVILDLGGFAGTLPVNTTAFARIQPVPFGREFVLRGANIDSKGELTLLWRASRRMADNFTVFVHLTDAEGNLAYQNDAPPLLATRYLERGEYFVTTHAYDLVAQGLPPGAYTLKVGWYQPITGERVALPNRLDPLGDDALTLLPVTIPDCSQAPPSVSALRRWLAYCVYRQP
ncbi:MAG: hypothetical protein ACOYL5_04875 [Phototrophicaceae bacterium]